MARPKNPEFESRQVVPGRAQREDYDDDYRSRYWIPDSMRNDPQFEYRWVRSWNGETGELDTTNIQDARFEGWEPVKGADAPELTLDIPGLLESGEFIRRGTEILMRAERGRVQKRRERLRRDSYDQVTKAEQFLADAKQNNLYVEKNELSMQRSKISFQEE